MDCLPLLRLALALAITAWAGCATDFDFHSEGTAIKVTVDGRGGTEVSICAGPRDLLDCNASEAFLVALDGVKVVPEETLLSFGTQYAWFETDRAGSEVVVSRRRDGATATVTLPEPLELEAPAPGATYSRGDDVQLRWSPSGTGDALQWTATAACDSGTSSTYSDDVDDDGEATIDDSDLPALDEDCGSLGITLDRSHDGEVAGLPDDSSIAAQQTRVILLPLAP